MQKIRQQLSLYVPIDDAVIIEEVRKIVDPIQHQLIPAHITLCREDELEEFAKIKARLSNIPLQSLTLRLGQPEVFSSHGWLMNCIEGEDEFRALREYVLDGKNIRNQSPHLTIAHPRNPKAVGNSLHNISALPGNLTITFSTIYLIEQAGNEPWQVLEKYSL
jgi:2'-5' RNA ligase superfamily